MILLLSDAHWWFLELRILNSIRILPGCEEMGDRKPKMSENTKGEVIIDQWIQQRHAPEYASLP